MTTITLDDNSPEARAFVEYSKLLPFVQSVEEPEKLTFEEAKKRYGAHSIGEFIGELRRQVDAHFERQNA